MSHSTDRARRPHGRRALVISQLPPPVHGSTLMTGHLLRILGELGWSSTLVDRRFSASVAEVGRARAGKLLRVPALYLRLLRALLTFRPQVCVFFVTNRRGSFLVDLGMAAILRLFPRCRVIHYVHTSGYRDLARAGSLWARLVRFLLTTADTIVTLGPSLEDDVRPLAGRAAVTSIPNTVVPPQVAAPGSTTPTLLFLSNLIPEKGAADFVEVAGIVAKDHAQVRFVVAGPPTDPDYAEALARRAAELGIAGRTDFVGPVAEEKWRLLADATALVFPSRYPYEAQPLTIVEAMAVGTPVIAYRTGGVRDLVDDGVSGWLVEPGDIPRVAALATGLLDRPDGLDRMQEGARHRFATTHELSSYRRAWASVLEGRPRS